MISLHFYRINTEWLQRAGEETAKESTCNYVEVICSTGASTQPLVVFTELGCFDKTGGKPQVTNEYGGLGGKKKDICNDPCNQHLLHSLSPTLSNNPNNDYVTCSVRIL